MSNQSGGGPGPQSGGPNQYGGNQGGGYGGGNDQHDFSGAMQHAQQHGQQQYGHDPDDNAVYAHAINHLQNNQASIQNSPLNMNEVQSAQQAVYHGQGSPQPPTAQAIGMGAAAQAFHNFAHGQGQGGQSGGPVQTTSSLAGGTGGGQSQQNMLMGMAMAEAKQMFGKPGSGNAVGYVFLSA